MAVNGIEIKVGQTWVLFDGSIGKITRAVDNGMFRWMLDDGLCLTDKGQQFNDERNVINYLVKLAAMPDKVADELDKMAGDAHEALTFHPLPSQEQINKSLMIRLDKMGIASGVGIGDINGTAKGTGARYNSGKPAMELVPLSLIAFNAMRHRSSDPLINDAVYALGSLGAWQERNTDESHLQKAIDYLNEIPGAWEECAQVFDYGRKKYAAWNWARGMAWSVPLACAARHLMAIMRGEILDLDKPGAPGSGLPHRGHAMCNLVMLATYANTYPEGDDRPAAGLLAPVSLDTLA